MREIKFRAWHKDIKEMFKVGQITLEKGMWDYQPENRKHIGISIPCQPSFILMQYTGLHDKNGKEIYEGDIIEWTTLSGNKNRFSVEYSDKYAQYVSVNTKDVLMEYEPLGDYENIEVIGNVFENGDILNDSKNTEKN